MGLRYRKSINLGGGFRINLSKSGVGYSWGGKGFRYTKTANGRTRRTLSIPGTGISYVDESKSKNKNQPKQYTENDITDYETIKNANVSNFRNEEYIEFINALEDILSSNKTSNIFIWISIILFPVPIIGILCMIASLVYKYNIRKNGVINLEYEMDQESSETYKSRMDSWKIINTCDKLWSISSTSSVSNKKIHAGAGTLVTRKEIKLSDKLPFYLKSNINIYTLANKNETIILLPDKIIIIQNNKVGVVSYDDLEINVHQTRFIENESVPKDATIIEYTWQYVNKNGTPDKRHKNNKQLPVCNYGEISIKSKSGINILLNVSDFTKIDTFKVAFKK